MDLLYSFTTHTESWIEVSSRPSSSSLSSTATDEVVTTGLRVAQERSSRRRRQLRRSSASQARHRMSGPASRDNEISQEEYDESESESESDRVMTSSNEDLQPGFRKEEQHDESPPVISKSTHSDGGSIESVDEEEDDDENATALGVVDPTPFTPQPHAFSHPPSTRLTQRQPPSQDSYFPAVASPAGATSQQTQTTATTAPTSISSRAHIRTRSHTPYNVIAPNHSVDHDAALRASLSTLLSCAAAARGLGKRENYPPSTSAQSRPSPLSQQQRSRQSSRVEQGTLRIVPESALSRVNEQQEQPPTLPRRPSPSTTDSPGSSPVPGPPKRKAKSPARDRRKKHRSSSTYMSGSEHDMASAAITPTLTTWVVGAGVLVLFSAISFSAGYALGKEVGRVDAMGGGAGMSALSCGSEAEGVIGRGIGRSSRAWRWGNGSGVRA